MEETGAMLGRLMTTEERADLEPVPPSEFSREALERQRDMNLMSTLRLMKLMTRQRTPDFIGLLAFARNKFRYFDDDLEHADPLRVP